jgi:hypothetical protein
VLGTIQYLRQTYCALLDTTEISEVDSTLEISWILASFQTNPYSIPNDATDVINKEAITKLLLK